MIVRCEMCFSDIGSCDPATVHAPLSGAMFGPLGPGFTPPFAPDAPFEALLCPLCGRRAVGHDMDRPETFRRDRLLTPEGYFVAEGAAENPLTHRPGGMDKMGKMGKTGRIGHSGRPGRSAEARGAAHV